MREGLGREWRGTQGCWMRCGEADGVGGESGDGIEEIKKITASLFFDD